MVWVITNTSFSIRVPTNRLYMAMLYINYICFYSYRVWTTKERKKFAGTEQAMTSFFSNTNLITMEKYSSEKGANG